MSRFLLHDLLASVAAHAAALLPAVLTAATQIPRSPVSKAAVP